MEKTNYVNDEMIKKDFFNWVIKQRDEQGWNDAELSTAANISQSNLSLILSGQRNITFDFCVAIAKAFRIRPEEVLYKAGLLTPPVARVDELNDDEGELVGLYRELPAESRETILEMLRGWVEIKKRQK